MEELDELGFEHVGPGSRRVLMLIKDNVYYGKIHCKRQTQGRGWHMKKWYDVNVVCGGKIIVDKMFEREDKMVSFVKGYINGKV